MNEAKMEPVGKVVACTGSLNDFAAIQWTGEYRPKVGDLIYGPDAAAIIAERDTEIANARRTAEYWKASNLVASSEIDRLTQELSSKSRYADLRQQLEAMKQEAQKANNANAELQDEIMSLRDKYYAVAEELEETTDQLGDMNIKLAAKDAEIKALQTDSYSYGIRVGTEKCDELRAQLAAAQADAERLDWIQRQDFDNLYFTIFHDHPNDGLYGVSIGAGWSVGETFREAIDAARKEGE